MRILAINLLLLFMSSCATIINSKFTEVNLYTKQDSVKVHIDDSASYSYCPAELIVLRSKKPLSLTLEKNNFRKNIFIPSKLTPEFWIGNIINETFCFGYLVDLSNDKRFKYPTNIYYDINHENNVDYKYRPSIKPTNSLRQKYLANPKNNLTEEQGTLSLKLSIPEGNSFVINKNDHIGNSFGFLGITTELSYYFKNKISLGVGAGTLTDFIIPIPAPYDVEGEYERSFGSYIDLLNGIDLNRFTIKYGFSISKYSYYRRITKELFPNYIDSLLYSKKENRLGLSVSAKYKLTNYFNIGIKYIPSLYTLESKEYRYGHLLFLDIAINFEIWHRKKN